MEKKPPRELIEILDQIHNEGYRAGTPQFDFILKKRKVERCQDMRRITACQACNAYDYCDLVKSYMRDLADIQYAQQHPKKSKEG
jgi:hypothetical protein